MFRGVDISVNARLKSTHRLYIPTAAGPSQCFACAERDEATCRANQFRQTFPTSHYSLGTGRSWMALFEGAFNAQVKKSNFFKEAAKCLNSLT